MDWHLHRCWTGSEYQYDEPPGLDEYERFLAYDLLSEALGWAGVLAPIRYECPSDTNAYPSKTKKRRRRKNKMDSKTLTPSVIVEAGRSEEK